jgi:hypothetical protein
MPPVLEKGRAMAAEYARARAQDPWLRSASLLSYSLRSRRRGFLDDPARPFTRAALRFLFRLAWLGGPSGVSPLAETVIHDSVAPVSPALARATSELLELHRDALDRMDTDFEGFIASLG